MLESIVASAMALHKSFVVAALAKSFAVAALMAVDRSLAVAVAAVIALVVVAYVKSLVSERSTIMLEFLADSGMFLGGMFAAQWGLNAQ